MRNPVLVTLFLCLGICLVDSTAALATNEPTALRLPTGEVLPSYPVSGDPAVRTVSYRLALKLGKLSAYSQSGNELWQRAVEADGTLMTGGFDFDSDGWPDIALVRSEPASGTCNSKPMRRSWIEFVSGRTGGLTTPVAKVKDWCWTNSGVTVGPQQQWTSTTPLFGSGTSVLAMTEYYYGIGWYFAHAVNAGWSTLGSFYTPFTNYFNTYARAKQISLSILSHVPNGLIVPVGGSQRLVFWTSGRVLQYRIAPLSTNQLISDYTYKSGTGTGRNYGLTALDPNSRDRVWLIAGTDAGSVFEDMRTGKLNGSDPWGGIERHITVYLPASNTIQDRFFSACSQASCPKPQSEGQLEGRVVYPASPFVRTTPGGLSRLAYNVYSGGHWYLHISGGGGTNDLTRSRDAFLWDIRDLDGDGVDEWLYSPSRFASDPPQRHYYFPKWLTYIAHWDEANRRLVAYRSVPGIPYLQPAFRQPGVSTSRGSLYPALVRESANGQRLLLWLDEDRQTIREEPVD